MVKAAPFAKLLPAQFIASQPVKESMEHAHWSKYPTIFEWQACHLSTVRILTGQLDTAHSEYDLAIGFCYGFFEGATHYDDALAGSGLYNDILCSPEGVTRTQAATVFVQYLKDNPQYGIEPPIDAIFRALIAKWPCSE
jgi:hypothetical protein